MTTDNTREELELCPLRVVENAEGTWDILVDGALTHPRLTQWTKGGAEEAVRLIHEAYTRSRAAVAAPQGDDSEKLAEAVMGVFGNPGISPATWAKLKAVCVRAAPSLIAEQEREPLPDAPEIDPKRKCWASTSSEVCIDPRSCDDRGCQLYADEDYRSKRGTPTSRDIRAELIAAHSAAATPPTATAAEHERCNVSITGRHRLIETYCKDCGQTFAASIVTATSARECAEENALADAVQRRKDQVVDAAVEWHQAGREGDEWFDAAEKLSTAIDSLLELRDAPPASETQK